jgi:CheY-like chemotaxis protein
VSHAEDYGLPPGVREEYLQGARDQLGGIAELAERLVAAGDDVAAVDAIRREAHRIHGSAGSFGFPHASVVAAELEAATNEWLKHPDRTEARGAAARMFVRRLAVALFTKQATAPLPPTAALTPRIPRDAPQIGTEVPDVVLVEDDAALVDLITFGLEARGYRFVHYQNGREALAGLQALDTGDATPVLLLDVDLPALDGYSIFETLQRDRPGKFRVVFMTVHGTEAEQLRGLEAGAVDYLVKPVSLRVALEKLRHWVGK